MTSQTISQIPQAPSFQSLRTQTPFDSPSTLSLEPLEEEGEEGGLYTTSTWLGKQRACLSSLTHRTVDAIQNNAGLLLVAASQAFLSMMNVAVKKLNNLDPPVPAFEVSSHSISHHDVRMLKLLRSWLL